MEEDKRVVLIGDGRMAQEALRVLEEHPLIDVVAVACHRDSDHGFKDVRQVDPAHPHKLIECDNVNEAHVISGVRDVAPDLLLSVNNWDLIGQELLALPTDGAINFHNGPLPRYRGSNIPSWAIINGETRHSVTWHFMDASVDGGPIVSEREFDISESETAISLIFKCIDEGIAALPGLLDDYVSGSLVTIEQSGTERCYLRRDTPNGGRIDFEQDFDSIDRLVRGLTFHPFPNDFVPAHIVTEAGRLNVGVVRLVPAKLDNASPGRVEAVDDGAIVVQCMDAHVSLEYLVNDEGTMFDRQRLESDCGLRPGINI